MPLAPQYDVELFQKIEALIGLKMEQYGAEQEAVLLLLERVGEAQRIATMQARRPLRRPPPRGRGWGAGECWARTPVSRLLAISQPFSRSPTLPPLAHPLPARR